jgi:hypothetical protein
MQKVKRTLEAIPIPGNSCQLWQRTAWDASKTAHTNHYGTNLSKKAWLANQKQIKTEMAWLDSQ